MPKSSLRLGPLPETAKHRVLVVLPAPVKADLDRYAQVYSSAYGRKVEAADLIPYIVATFIKRDRHFRRLAR